MSVTPALTVPTAVLHSDPAWRGRVFWLLAALVLLWPALVLSEFKPWVLFEASNLKPTLKFLSDFVPPKVEPEFLLMVARETWRTVAIATAGMALALLLAVPLTLMSVRLLSVSALSGRMALLPSGIALVLTLPLAGRLRFAGFSLADDAALFYLALGALGLALFLFLLFRLFQPILFHLKSHFHRYLHYLRYLKY